VSPTFGRHRKTIACALAVVAMAVSFMAESLMTDRMLAPLDVAMSLRPWSTSEYRVSEIYNELTSDKVSYIHPIKVLIGRAFRAGQLPLWEPHLLAGYPIIGNAQAGIFYPLTLPYAVLSGADASDLVALIHLIAAGLGMLGYLRAIGCRHLAALMGAIVFMFNQVTLVWLMWDSVAGAMVWLPWVFWAFEVSLQPRRFRVSALGAVAVGLTILGGHLQWSLYALSAVMLYGLFRLVWPQGSSRRRVLAAASVVLGAGIALAMLQILPTLEYVRDGHREPLPFEDVRSLVGWEGFATLWSPRFFGGVAEFWGPFNYNESVIYVGIAPLLLSLVAIGLRRDAVALFFAGLGVLGSLCAAGTEVDRLLHALPGLDRLLPLRMRYLVAVALSVLSALGLDWLLDRISGSRPPRASALLAICGGLCAAYWLVRVAAMPAEPDQVAFLHRQERVMIAWMLASTLCLVLGVLLRTRGTYLLAGLCALALVDLWLPGAAYQRPISTRFYFPPTPGIQMMMNDPDRFRVLSVKTEPWLAWELRPNLASLFGLEDAAGYDSVYDRRYATYLERADRSGTPYASSIYLSASRFDSPLVDLLNVKYALSNQRDTPPGWELVHTGDMRIFRRAQPLPRAWIAGNAEVVPDAAGILEKLAAPEFDPRRTVLLERSPIESRGTDSAQPPGVVRFDRYERTRLALTAQMEGDGWLVLSELFHPGWRVSVDGAPANLYRADYILRAIPLARGRHTIEMHFMPSSFVVGTAISLAAAVFLLGVAVVSRRADLP